MTGSIFCILQVTQVIDPASSAVVDAAKLLKDGCKGEVVFIEYDTVCVELLGHVLAYFMNMSLQKSSIVITQSHAVQLYR